MNQIFQFDKIKEEDKMIKNDFEFSFVFRLFIFLFRLQFYQLNLLLFQLFLVNDPFFNIDKFLGIKVKAQWFIRIYLIENQLFFLL